MGFSSKCFVVCLVLGSSILDVLAGPVEMCDFESRGSCFLRQSKTDTSNWRVKKGQTKTKGTGPKRAYEGKRYVYFEASKRGQNLNAVLESELDTSEEMHCVKFAYHMYGDGNQMGALKVYSSPSDNDLIFSVTGHQSKKWQTEMLAIAASPQFQLRFEATKLTSPKGDIALDKIQLKSGHCGCLSNPCANGATCVDGEGGAFTCSCAEGFTGDDCAIISGDVSCTFEKREFCFLEQSKEDVFNWKMNSRSTPTKRTGPSKAKEGKMYAYMEASNPQKKDHNTILTSESHTFTAAARCLRFAYHMRGSKTTNDYHLKVIAGDRSDMVVGPVEVWTKNGNQANGWQSAQVDLPSATDLLVKFEAIRGSTPKSDIAIDDVQLTMGTCTSAIEILDDSAPGSSSSSSSSSLSSSGSSSSSD